MKALVISAGGGIGDVLLATPVMRALRSRYSEVVAITAERHCDVLSHDPDLAGVWSSDEPFVALTRRIAAGNFDAAVVTWATARLAALPFAAGIRRRVGQARRPYSFLFTDRVEVRSELGDRTTHWTQILLDYARALGCDVADATPVFALRADDESEAAAVLRGAGVDEPFLIVHPTRGLSSERPAWPAAHLGGLARELGQRFGMPVLVSGASSDRAIAEFVAEAAAGRSIAGRATIGGFAALARRARVVVAMDSGPMHVAAAVGAPTVGIFAMQPDEPDRWRPLGPRVAIVRPSYPCPPGHRKETCPDFACVAALDIETVVARAREACAA